MEPIHTENEHIRLVKQELGWGADRQMTNTVQVLCIKAGTELELTDPILYGYFISTETFKSNVVRN